MRRNYKYKIFNAQICIICNVVEVDEDWSRNRIRPMVCGECSEKMYKRLTEYNKNGIYLTKENELILAKGIQNEKVPTKKGI